MVDWIQLYMNYTKSNSSAIWYCLDGHSIPNKKFGQHSGETDIKPTQDETQNCFLVNERSNNTIKDNTGYFKVNFVRPLGTDDTTEQDLQMLRGDNVAAQVRIKWPGEDRATYTTIVLPDVDSAFKIGVGLLSLLWLI